MAHYCLAQILGPSKKLAEKISRAKTPSHEGKIFSVYNVCVFARGIPILWLRLCRARLMAAGSLNAANRTNVAAND
jgi:hypothetical protein